MKVLHVVHQLGVGGTEKTAVLFCKYLKKLGVEVSIYSFKGGPRVDEATRYGVPVHIGDPFDLADYCTANKFDVLHLHRGGWAEEWWRHFTLMYDAPDINVFETNIFGDADRTTSGSFIDRHLFVSDYIQNWYEVATVGDFAPNHQSKLGRVFNPVELQPDTFDSSAARLGFRMLCGVPEDAFVVGRIGRADNHDGISVKALKYLWENGQNVWLVSLCPTEQMVRDLENEPRAVLVRDPIIDSMDLHDFYAAVDGMLHDRCDGETFGCGIAEAMAHGKPTVSHLSVKYQGQLETLGDPEAARKTIGHGHEDLRITEGIKEVLGGYVVNNGDWLSYSDCILGLKDVSEARASSMKRWVRDRYEASMIAEQLKREYDGCC